MQYTMGELIVPTIVLVLALAYGIVATLKPMTLTRLSMAWARYIFPKISSEKQSPKQFRAMRLIEEDPEQYKKENQYPLFVTRLGGIVTLFIGLCGLFGVVGTVLGLLTP